MEQFEGINFTVLSKLELVAMGDVQSIPNSCQFPRDAIILKNGEGWLDVKFTHQSASFRENEELANGGFFWKKQVNFSIPKLRNEISEEISKLGQRRLYALATDLNGICHLVFPLRMERVKEVAGQADGSNAYRFELAGEHTRESPFVTEATAGSGSGGTGI